MLFTEVAHGFAGEVGAGKGAALFLGVFDLMEEGAAPFLCAFNEADEGAGSCMA